MAKLRGRLSDDDNDWLLFGLLVTFFAMLAALAAGLVLMLKPTVLANPGVAAYQPPPLTLLYPPPREPDELASRAPSFNSLAAEYELPQPEAAKQPAERRVILKRKRTTPRDVAEQAYARSWNDGDWNDRYRARYDGFRGWNSDRQSSKRRQRDQTNSARVGRSANGGGWFR